MKDNHDITPGEDKFLRIHIDNLSQPIRHSLYATRNRRNSDGTSSLVLAILTLAGTIAIVYFTK